MKSLFFSLVALFVLSLSSLSFSQDTSLKVVEYRNKIVVSVSTALDTLKTENADEIAFSLRTDYHAEKAMLKAIKSPGQKIVYKNKTYRDYNALGTKWRSAKIRYFYVLDAGVLRDGNEAVITGNFYSAKFVYIMIIWTVFLGVLLGCQKFFDILWDESTMKIVVSINVAFAIAYSWIHNYGIGWETVIGSAIGAAVLGGLSGLILAGLLTELSKSREIWWIVVSATILTTTHTAVVGASFVTFFMTFGFIVVLETVTTAIVKTIVNKLSAKPAPPVVIAE